MPPAARSPKMLRLAKFHSNALVYVDPDRSYRAYAAVGGSEVGQRPQYSGAAAWPETDSTVESLPVLHIHRDCAGRFEIQPVRL
jgi:hypothetical protein